MIIDILMGYMVTINIVAFFIFGYDKYAAKKKLRRISERQLLVLLFVGGILGSLLGQSFFRHKTQKTSFLYKFYAICLLWFALLSFLLYRF